jgi:hypothetical protein
MLKLLPVSAQQKIELHLESKAPWIAIEILQKWILLGPFIDNASVQPLSQHFCQTGFAGADDTFNANILWQ